MKVSVIIPTYNYGSFIKESIDSVLDQTYGDFELLVIDDGSTDDTLAIVAEISDPRLEYVKIPNGGVSVARNKGIDLAKGEYIAFLDADDKWLPEKLDLQVRILDEYPDVGLVFTDIARFNKNVILQKSLFKNVPELEAIGKKPILEGRGFIISDDTFASLATMSIFITWVQASLFRANKIDSIRFPVGVRLSEDYYFMLRIYEQVIAACIPESLVLVRRHDNNSHNTSEELLKPTLVALYSAMDELSGHDNKEILKLKISHAWLSIGYHHYWFGNVRSAIYAYYRALFFPGVRLAAFLHLLAIPVQPLIRKIRPRPRPKF